MMHVQAFFLYSLIVQRYGKKGKQWKTLSGSLFSLLWLAYSQSDSFMFIVYYTCDIMKQKTRSSESKICIL